MLEKITVGISVILLMYLGASVIDINMHNTSDHRYADWNLIANIWQNEDADTVSTIYIADKTIEEEPITIKEYNEIIKVEYPGDYVSEEDVELLAHVLYAEAGSDWLSDDLIYSVGSVVINRINSSYFPDNLYDVIYQENQYACVEDGNINKNPSQRCYDIAEDLLRNGSRLPENVVFQAGFTQGIGTYKVEQNVYFCYIAED